MLPSARSPPILGSVYATINFGNKTPVVVKAPSMVSIERPTGSEIFTLKSIWASSRKLWKRLSGVDEVVVVDVSGIFVVVDVSDFFVTVDSSFPKELSTLKISRSRSGQLKATDKATSVASFNSSMSGTRLPEITSHKVLWAFTSDFRQTSGPPGLPPVQIQSASTRQVAEQPSPLPTLPSSHCSKRSSRGKWSVGTSKPSPHLGMHRAPVKF
mmetsp:Transcript_63392/g.205830  ORF Transcript_63392/g.205830 Transcript_63392/m.205830 type:complete len:213 (+) Transcript_63392:773-1411(+)